MSLINQMLKDLEQRGAGANDASNLASKISPTPLDTSAKSGNAFPFVKIGLLLALAAAGYYAWQLTTHKAAQAPAITLNTAKPTEVPASAESKPVVATPAETTKPAEAQIATNSNSAGNSASGNLQTKTATASKPAPQVSEATPLFARSLQYTAAEYLAPKKSPATDKAASSKLDDTINKLSVGKTEASKTADAVAANSSSYASKPATKLSKELSNKDHDNTGKQIRPEQKSSNYYRSAIANLQQGRVSEAEDNLKLALEANPANQDARQTLAGLLLDNKRNDEAKSVLSAGLAISPEQTDFRMALARLQVDGSDRSGALATLEQGLPYAKNNAEYQSFTATMLQRAERHDEAISHYSAAISLNPSNTNALIGLGISAQAVGKLDTAKEAFTRAQTSTTLSAELSAFVEQRLKQINQKLARS